MRKHRIAGFAGAAAVITGVTLLVASWVVPAWGQGGATTHASSDDANAKLIHQIAAARLATAKYATDLDRAKADGYGIITQMIPNMGIHYMNPNITGFDVRKPPILVYEHHRKHWQLGALEWVFPSMPTTPPLDNATFGFFPAACHYVDGTFVPESDQTACPKRSPQSGAAFNFWHPDLFTMHLWIWYPNPAGLYSGTNPLITPFNGG
jgi:hypothetical protein